MLVDKDNHSSWCSNSSRKWPPSYSWHTTVSSSFHPQPAASPPPSASLPLTQASPSLAPNSASSQPWSVLDANIEHNHVQRLLRTFIFRLVYAVKDVRRTKYPDYVSFQKALADAATGVSQSRSSTFVSASHH